MTDAERKLLLCVARALVGGGYLAPPYGAALIQRVEAEQEADAVDRKRTSQAIKHWISNIPADDSHKGAAQ